MTVLKAEDVPAHVLKYSGARPADRDAVDKRLVEEFYNGSGKIINSQDEVGGYPKAEPVYRELRDCNGDIEKWLRRYTYEVMVH